MKQCSFAPLPLRQQAPCVRNFVIAVQSYVQTTNGGSISQNNRCVWE